MRFLVAVAVAEAAVAAVDASGEVVDPAAVPFAAQANAMENLWEAARSTFLQSSEATKPSPARVKALASSLLEMSAQARYDALDDSLARQEFERKVQARMQKHDPLQPIRQRVEADLKKSDASFMHAAHLDDPTFFKAFKDGASLVQASLLETKGKPPRENSFDALFGSKAEEEEAEAKEDTKKLLAENEKATDQLSKLDLSLPSLKELHLDTVAHFKPPMTDDERQQIKEEKKFEEEDEKEEEREEEQLRRRKVEQAADTKQLEDLVANAGKKHAAHRRTHKRNAKHHR